MKDHDMHEALRAVIVVLVAFIAALVYLHHIGAL